MRGSAIVGGLLSCSGEILARWRGRRALEASSSAAGPEEPRASPSGTPRNDPKGYSAACAQDVKVEGQVVDGHRTSPRPRRSGGGGAGRRGSSGRWSRRSRGRGARSVW